jgi:hypothetical protein
MKRPRILLLVLLAVAVLCCCLPFSPPSATRIPIGDKDAFANNPSPNAYLPYNPYFVEANYCAGVFMPGVTSSPNSH